MKKGLLFSVISSIMILTVFMMITGRSAYLSKVDSISSQKIISDQMKKYADSIELDIVKALKISGERAILSSIGYIISNNSFLDDSKLRIQEEIFNGTLYEQELYLMIDNTLPSWKDRISSKGTEMGFDTDITLLSFDVTMEDGFNVKLTVGYNLNISEESGMIRIDKYVERSSFVSIENFEDPVFSLKTYGRINRIIQKNPYEQLAVFSEEAWDVTNLDDFIEQGYYIESLNSPSFLDRMEGKLYNENGVGVFSIVNLAELYANDIDIIADETTADYLYFDEKTDAGAPINETEHDWFRIDELNAEVLGLSELI